MSPQREEQQYAITDRELLGLCQRELDSSLGWTGTRLSEARRRNLNAYFGNPRGDERDGRSQAQTRDVFEQVEWSLPPLMEIFLSGNEVVKFEPVGPEDEPVAQQQTDACNYFFRKEHGPMVLYTAFKDALVERLGVVKVTYEYAQDATIETYRNKNLAEVTLLDADEDFEVRAATPFVEMNGNRMDFDPEDPALAQIDPMQIRYDVEGVRTHREGRLRLENVVPEEFTANRECKSLRDDTCRFVDHRVPVSVSMLISWGIPREVAEAIPATQATFASDQNTAVRSSQDDSNFNLDTARKDSEKRVYLHDIYVKADRDGDGISEWWRVLCGGEHAQMFIAAAPVGGHPFVAGTPIPIPHRLNGLALADVVLDKQDQNSSLLRSILDSAYLANDPRNVVLMQGIGDAAIPLVDIEQLNRSAPGTWIGEYAPGALRPYEQQSNIADLFPVLEYNRKDMQSRTGINPDAQGIDPQSISKHVYGAMVQSTAAQQRVVLFARIFAETLVTDLFKLMARTIAQNVGEEFYIRLRGDWVPIDPSSWENELDCTIAVGLGHGSRMERVSNLMTIANIQKEFIAGGLTNIVSEEELHNTASELTEALGFKDTIQFFKKPDPVKNPTPPPEPSPEEKAIQLQQHVEIVRLEIERQKVETERYRAMGELKKIELQHEEKMEELRLKGSQAAMDDPSFSLVGGRANGSSSAEAEQ